MKRYRWGGTAEAWARLNLIKATPGASLVNWGCKRDRWRDGVMWGKLG